MAENPKEAIAIDSTSGACKPPERQSWIWRWVNAYLAGLAIVFMLGGVEWFQRAHMLDGNTDFTTFYVASRLMREAPQRLYDLSWQLKTQTEVLGDYKPPEGFLPYIHPPFEAFLFLPLTTVPFRVALLLWMVISLALLLMLPSFLCRSKSNPLKDQSLTCFLGALAFFPFLACLWRGQTSILVLWALVLFHSMLVSRKEGWAGFFLALGFIKFHLTYLFLIPLLVGRRFRALASAALTLMALVAASMWWLGASTLLNYPRVMLDMATTLGKMANPQGKMQCWLGQAYLLGFEQVHGLVGRGAVAIVAVILSFWIWKGWTNERTSFDVRFAALILLAVLASPHNHVYDLSLVYFSEMLLLRTLLAGENAIPQVRLVGIMLAVSPLVWLLTLWVAGHTRIQISVVWMTIVLVIALGWIPRPGHRSLPLEAE
ncbi:MAG: glycosyltransferase family 87 protein [Acidobacteriota bacterium]